MYNLFLNMYRYVFWHQTFYSTPCPFSPKNQVWLPRYKEFLVIIRNLLIAIYIPLKSFLLKQETSYERVSCYNKKLVIPDRGFFVFCDLFFLRFRSYVINSCSASHQRQSERNCFTLMAVTRIWHCL